MKKYQIHIFIFLILITLCLKAQKKEVHSPFRAYTIDVIYWDNVEYMCSISPLSVFENYKTIFGSLTINTPHNPEAPIDVDKNYQAKWTIKDSSLYLYEVKILDGAENYPDKYTILEKLTNRKIVKHFQVFNKPPEVLLPAHWFTGFIYVKRQPEAGESYCDCIYKIDYNQLLFFVNGFLKYVYKKNLFIINFLDSSEVINDKKYIYMKQQNYYIERDQCSVLLVEKLALNDNERLTSFQEYSNDQIIWNDTTCMLNESPLSFFNGYKNLFPHLWYDPKSGGFLSEEKNYIAKWIINNGKLYVTDIVFPFENTSYLDDEAEKQRIEYIKKYRPTRLQAIEKLTQRKFLQVLPLNMKVVFADWYSGTLYFKRFARTDEYLSRSYTCEPFYQIIVEKGEIKSMQKTSYMIVKTN